MPVHGRPWTRRGRRCGRHGDVAGDDIRRIEAAAWQSLFGGALRRRGRYLARGVGSVLERASPRRELGARGLTYHRGRAVVMLARPGGTMAEILVLYYSR